MIETRTLQKSTVINEIIRSRRSVFADAYIDKEIPKPIIEQILINATWAPNHKMTQPWRFVVLSGNYKARFGDFMADFYKSKLSTEEFSEEREKLVRNYPLKSGCMIAIIMQHNKKVNLPEWEELAAVSCAVQNIALSCTAYDIGGYWDSCEACIAYGQSLNLSENEKCLGFFYMGYYDKNKFTAKKNRKPLEKKVVWMGE